jgi:glutamate-5-semialdehyde dehydrogenase
MTVTPKPLTEPQHTEQAGGALPAVDMAALGRRARAASRILARASTDEKNRALLAIADALERERDSILEANAHDLEAARARGLTEQLIRDRYDLTRRLPGIIADVRSVAALPDPVGVEYDARTLANGLAVSKRRTPIGVLGIIYEARPNVTVDCAVLALKTGNAAILRGGSDVHASNMRLIALIRDVLGEAGGHIPADAVLAIDSTDRAHIETMLKLNDHIDMIIPRGGASLHHFCRQNSTIPVITGGLGVCHIYIDSTADLAAALPIVDNAKTQRPSVCNAVDTVLVHEAVAAAVLPQIVALLRPKGVEFRAEPRALALVGQAEGVHAAGPEDFDTEWMALILGLKVVGSLDEALEHIAAHSTQHSEAILTRTPEHAARFIDEADSAAVFVNTSTRFNDGGALGLGAEIAISTQKLHARGPMGLEELTTYKWIVRGDGQIRP